MYVSGVVRASGAATWPRHDEIVRARVARPRRGRARERAPPRTPAAPASARAAADENGRAMRLRGGAQNQVNAAPSEDDTNGLPPKLAR